MNLEKLSRDLSDIHESFKNINAGGCGEFAKMLGNKLKENNVKFKYVLISEDKRMSILASQRNFKTLKEDVLNDPWSRQMNGYGIAHIMIYHNGYFIDSTGAHRGLGNTLWHQFRGYQISAILPQDVLIDWCGQNTWNDMFDRKQIPYIENRIKNLILN